MLHIDFLGIWPRTVNHQGSLRWINGELRQGSEKAWAMCRRAVVMYCPVSFCCQSRKGMSPGETERVRALAILPFASPFSRALPLRLNSVETPSFLCWLPGGTEFRQTRVWSCLIISNTVVSLRVFPSSPGQQLPPALVGTLGELTKEKKCMDGFCSEGYLHILLGKCDGKG